MAKKFYECPHCRKETVSSYQKIFSVSFSPAYCPQCRKQSYVSIIHGLTMLTAWMIMTWIFIGLAIMAGMSFFLLGTFPALIVCIDRYLLNAPLVARDPPIKN